MGTIVDKALWNRKSLSKSCLTSEEQNFGMYYFFVPPISKRNYERPLIDIWMYDASNKSARKVFHENESIDDFRNIINMYWAFYIESKDAILRITGTGQKMKIIKKNAYSVIILSVANNVETVHVDPSVVIIDIIGVRY